MGLFDFIKDIGKDIVHKAADQASVESSLRDTVAKAQLNIQDFQVQFAKGLATISGLASSQKDLELARLIIGNHKGVEKVNDDGLHLAPAAATAASMPAAGDTAIPMASATSARTGASSAPARMVTVKSGDTLSKIAKEYLGNGNLYPELVAANQPMIKNADEIYPGQVIRVPEMGAAAH